MGAMGQRLDNATNLYLEGIRDGHAEQAITKYTGDRYTQHSGGVKDGRDGFIEFFEDFIERNPVRDIKIVRGFEDGQFVFVQAHQILNNGEFEYVTADIFDTDDNGRIIEHWDVIAEMSDESVSGHTQIDGPTDPTDLDKTDENKELVRNFLDDVLVNGNNEKVTDYISTETYIQHNPQVGDGLDGFGTFVAQLAEQGITMTYLKVHRLIGCGDFVVSLSHIEMGEAEMAVIDIFRVADRKIVEHWDVMEEIAPEEEWANSGKF